ncbi:MULTISPECIES: NUMOD4 domain-containing protein [unclassified Leucobacter]|uniref:NUMOD4 domain-containing protein n=1 Tax=unclassified Leucobacter TaxID=2621730 RepID=UPI0030190465
MQSTEPETWEVVVGYEGLYEVSDTGRVRNAHGRILKLSPTSNGKYLKVDLSNARGKRATKRVHRLVAEAFLGPAPAPGMTDCCHNDGNGHNNAVSNLRWDTRAGNIHDKDLHGTNFKRNVTHCPRGHELTLDNVIRNVWEKKRHRTCKKCKNEQNQAYREASRVNS